MTPSRIALTLALALAFAAGPASAEPYEVLVCYPGGGTVKASQAKPTMEKMMEVIGRLGAFSAGTFQHTFTAQVDDCRKHMAEKKPALAFTSLGLYLEHRKAHHLLPLVRPQVSGQAEEVYRVLVKKGAFADLAALKGKQLGGSLLDEPAFLHKIVFASKLDPRTHFALKPSKRALRALRDLDRGKLDAVLVNSQQFKALGALPFAKELTAVFTSAPVPLIGLAADEKKVAPADRARIRKALIGLCADAEGKKICALFGLENFTPTDPKAYNAAIGLWNAK